MESQVSVALARNPLIGSMPPEDRERLLAYARPAAFAEDDILFREGGSAQAFLLIVSGTVELSIAAGSRRTGVVGVLGGGDTAGEVAVLDGGPYPVTARALERVVALVIPGSAFLRHLEERAELLRGVMAGTSAKMRALMRENGELKAMPTAERLPAASGGPDGRPGDDKAALREARAGRHAGGEPGKPVARLRPPAPRRRHDGPHRRGGDP